jgi:DNA/RNA endonuclease YhcR with UshA esterase domain
MRGKVIIQIVAGLGILAVASVPWAAGPRAASGRERVVRYDLATEATLSGTIQHIEHAGIARREMGGTHLTLNTGDMAWEVRLCPRQYLAKENFTLSEGDRIEVTGSRVKFQERDAILARVVKRGDRALVLRDRQGRPEWSTASFR